MVAIVFVMVLALVGGIQAFFPGGHHSTTNHHQSNTASDMLQFLLATKGQAALNDPMVKSLAFMSVFNGEGAALSPQVMMALVGQMTTGPQAEGSALTPQMIMALSGQHTPMTTGHFPATATSPLTATAPAGFATPAEPAGEGGALSQVLNLLLIKSMMPQFGA